MRYAKIRTMDISNGDGIRASLFVQGCHFHCEGCFNKETWDFNKGEEWTKDIEEKFLDIVKQKHINGVSILGGEPFDQDDTLFNVLKRIKKETGKEIWLWTGYKFDNIPLNKNHWFEYIDKVTDGQFVSSLKDFRLKYMGSSNQKVYIKTTSKDGVSTWKVLDEENYY